MITIVDYGMGNMGSLRNMFRHIDVAAQVTADPAVIATADKVLLPGVGAFDAAMERIGALGLGEPLRDHALQRRRPLLGICLGMQLLTDGSEEGDEPGLGLIPATARRFPREMGLKVPHMGWNTVSRANPAPITDWMADEPETRFYFVHSYAVEVEDRADAMLTAHYGMDFDAGIRRDNIYGAQFHPEKSHRFGMALLRAFAAL